MLALYFLIGAEETFEDLSLARLPPYNGGRTARNQIDASDSSRGFTLRLPTRYRQAPPD